MVVGITEMDRSVATVIKVLAGFQVRFSSNYKPRVVRAACRSHDWAGQSLFSIGPYLWANYSYPYETTIEITDWLLEAAKDLARRERTTLRHLVETGLVQVLRDSDATGEFHLRDESFEGRGLQSAFKAAGWEQIHEAIDLHDDQDSTP